VNSTHVTTAAALIEGAACEPIWRIASAEIRRRQIDGGLVPPHVQRALEALRAAAQSHLNQQREQAMSARGQGFRAKADMTPESAVGELITTEQLADQLRVTARHARRLASEAGIEPAARNAWRPTDVDALVIQRRGQR
jgi:hypothetical protein